VKKQETPAPILAMLAWNVISKVLKAGERPERDWTEAPVEESLEHIAVHVENLRTGVPELAEFQHELEHILVRAAMALWRSDLDKTEKRYVKD
jgi:hypothetical protein